MHVLYTNHELMYKLDLFEYRPLGYFIPEFL